MFYTVTLNPAVDREYIVPDLVFDEVLRASAVHMDTGGKGFNVSRMLKALGKDSVAVAFAGGHCGSLLRDGLFRLGIGSEFIWIAGETRANISIRDGHSARLLKVNEPGPTISPSDFAALLARVHDLVAPGDWWVLAGSLPPGAPPDSYARLAALIHGRDGRVVLDSSGAALAEGCRAAPFLVKPNLVETAELTGLPVGSTAEVVAAAQAIRALGPAYVVISRGAEGALLAGPEGVWMAGSPAVSAGNPTGAGDALLAGLVWSLAGGESPPEALCWGVACGAATAARTGTAVGAHAEVSALRVQVRVKRVN